MGQELPPSVAARVDALEPYRERPAPGIPSLVTRAVPSVRDRNVPMELDLDRVEIAREVRGFRDRRQPLRLVLDAHRRTAGGPAVTMREAEVARARAIEKCDIPAHHGRLHFPFEC